MYRLKAVHSIEWRILELTLFSTHFTVAKFNNFKTAIDTHCFLPFTYDSTVHDLATYSLYIWQSRIKGHSLHTNRGIDAAPGRQGGGGGGYGSYW